MSAVPPPPQSPPPSDASDQPLHIVSVSLGSSAGNKRVEVEFLGRPAIVERIGTDGDFKRAAQMISELDGKVAAIGLGGIDLYLVAGPRRYRIREAAWLARHARTTPVVDGSGLKNTLERETVRYAQREGLLHTSDGATRRPRVLLLSAVDRFGMAEGVAETGADVCYGDLIFALKVPIPIHSLAAIRCIARLLLPIITRLPFKWWYPTGDKQRVARTQGNPWFRWADVIAGDFHFMGSNLPPAIPENADYLAGKTVITNTTTAADVDTLRALGLATLVTTTRRMEGRTFGTNVMEGVLVALSGKCPEELTEQDYLDLLARLNWTPTVDRLQE